MTNREKLEILKQAAKISDPGCGVWAYEKWDEFNCIYFENKLTVGGIQWGLTPHGHLLGFYSSKRNNITLHLSLINQDSKAWGKEGLLGEKFAADVLLHEMIHQWNHQVDNYTGKDSHNCQPWCDQINRIAPLLGLESKAQPIRQKRVKASEGKGNGKVTWFVEEGFLTRKELSTYPYSQRPDGYYEKSVDSLVVSVIAY